MARVATVWPRDVQQQQEQKKTQFFLGKKLDSSSEGSSAGLVFECWQQLKKQTNKGKKGNLVSVLL